VVLGTARAFRFKARVHRARSHLRFARYALLKFARSNSRRR
jgi:hypothetical protein